MFRKVSPLIEQMSFHVRHVVERVEVCVLVIGQDEDDIWTVALCVYQGLLQIVIIIATSNDRDCSEEAVDV